AGSPGSDADAEEIAEAAESNFLRGIQLTDANGVAEFTTIYPGWYPGRTVHIHMMVHIDGEAVDEATYDGGHVSHTGQLFFDDAISDQVYGTVEAYAGRDDSQRTRNGQDNILGGHLDEPGFLVSLSPLDENDPSPGLLGVITIGVDPSVAA
ncbi:MAG TPA: protocatechuate dioxygenase, partial [Chloroflexia bacterium]|nr:protocatechuate dioxygenase [Chloroflexia bacterium]